MFLALRKFLPLAAAGLAIAACSGESALGQVQMTVSFSAFELRQNGDPLAPIDNGKITYVKAPTQNFLTTQALLQQLAADETTNGAWFNTAGTVPRGARLVAEFVDSNLVFSVVSGTNSISVSNILTASRSPINVGSFSYRDSAGAGNPPFVQSDNSFCEIAYAPAGGGSNELQFMFTGVGLSTMSALPPNQKTGNYLAANSFRLIGGSGTGVNAAGVPFVISEVTFTASGMARLNCGCGTDEQQTTVNSTGLDAWYNDSGSPYYSGQSAAPYSGPPFQSFSP